MNHSPKLLPVETTTSTLGGSVVYPVNFDESNLQKLTLDSEDADLTFTASTNTGAGKTVKVYVVNTGGLSAVAVPSGWTMYGTDKDGLSGGNFIVELICWGSGDSNVTANIVDSGGM